MANISPSHLFGMERKTERVKKKKKKKKGEKNI